MLSLLIFSTAILAQARVEERTVTQKTQTQSQQKADYARKEKDKATDRVSQEEQDL